jgi:hypothetical protein
VVGTLLNLDMGGVEASELSGRNVPAEMADAEFRFGWRFAPEIQAKTVFVHEEGRAAVQQAYGSWSGGAYRVDFGKQSLPLGLFPGGLVHHPLLQQDLETFVPAVVGSLGGDGWTVRAGGAERSWVADSLEGAAPVGVGALERTWGGKGIARLSVLGGADVRIAGAAIRVPVGSLLFDLEGFAAEGAHAPSDGGVLAGILWTPWEVLDLGLRLDGRWPRGGGDLERDLVAGAVWRFAGPAYAGVEWMQLPGGRGIPTVRMGMESEWGGK